ncbi:hypothetical protein GCM10018785_65660 [Streptomyces longispororuber]|uniref:non-specific serine/threonine protein kinase n=1 Tax=Streptomyces longispororuber TaxID=68230 RepID=A0A919A6M7_9ACTN|nr:hypothetical protein GCM10018785_65660 [Streptomyces longispororuber]
MTDALPALPSQYDVVRQAARGYRKDYALDRLPIGEGGQAKIFNATHKPSGTAVVVKKRTSMGARGQRRMRREIEAAQALRANPHVMPVLDFCPSYQWFVMPRAEATAEQHRTDLQSPEQLRTFVDAIASALADAHRAGWLHRDIKPSNILLLDGHWRLADWGIVRRPRGQTTELLTKERIGTEEFAPPELSTNPHNATPASDLYSLGQVIGWILTGRTPQANVPLLPTPGHLWFSVLRRLTQPDPLERPQDVAGFIALVDRETTPPTVDPYVRARALLALAGTADESGGRQLISLAADKPEDYDVYVNALVQLPIDSAGPALADNSSQADFVLRSLAEHAAGNGRHRNVPADADRVVDWLFSVIFYATQTRNWQLLDEAMRAMCRWAAASDRQVPQTIIRHRLGMLSGKAAAIVAAVLRDQPDSDERFRVVHTHGRSRLDTTTATAPQDQSAIAPPGNGQSDLSNQRRARSSGLPDTSRGSVLTLLYQQADELGWCEMSEAARSDLYDQWVADPAIGGTLLPHFRSTNQVRAWIKDTAMHQFPRALEGMGPMTQYAPRTFRGPDEIAAAACGPGWTADPETVAHKPNRFIASNGDKKRVVVWGNPLNFRHLLWAAMNVGQEMAEAPVIAITTKRGAPADSANRAKQEAIAHRSGIQLVHLVRDLHPRPDTRSADRFK